MLRTDGHRLAALTPDSEPTRVLQALSRTRKDLLKARVALTNQLTAQLERAFPGAIGLFHELHSPVAIAFLRRYPTSQAAAALTPAKLAAFLRRLHYCGRKQPRSPTAANVTWKPTSSKPWRSTPTSTSSPTCPAPATASGQPRCSARSAMSEAASPTKNAWPPSPASRRSPSPPANATWSSSAGPATSSSARR